MSQVVVYPMSIDVEPGPGTYVTPRDEGHYRKDGERVHWQYVSDQPEEDCAYCKDGWCEQCVESCEDWECDVVTHARPRKW